MRYKERLEDNCLNKIERFEEKQFPLSKKDDKEYFESIFINEDKNIKFITH